ncbi:MAG: hypothetical protein Q4E83_06960 [bacterium]|nr:hypothetical protein [bacterium]
MLKLCIKSAFKEAVKAFNDGEECYYCDYHFDPIGCDMCRDETCKVTFVSRIFFAIKIFIIEYRHIKNFIKGLQND